MRRARLPMIVGIYREKQQAMAKRMQTTCPLISVSFGFYIDKREKTTGKHAALLCLVLFVMSLNVILFRMCQRQQ
jgi:hypothetical protein